MRNAPPRPSRQLVTMKESGERQRTRQAALRRVHWNTPAATSSTPPSSGLVVTIIGDMSATAWSAHCASAASTLKPVQTTR